MRLLFSFFFPSNLLGFSFIVQHSFILHGIMYMYICSFVDKNRTICDVLVLVFLPLFY